MATIRLDALRKMTLELADMEATAPDFVDTSLGGEVDTRINEGLSDLRDLIIEIQGQEFYATTDTFSTVVDQSEYSVTTFAAGVQHLLGVRSSDGQDHYQMRTWEYQERAELENATTYSTAEIYDYHYRLVEDNIIILPVPDSVNTISIDYVPEFVPLAADADTFKCPVNWWKFAALKAAIDLRNKAEEDVTGLETALAKQEAKIRSLAPRRDAGRPARVQDTRRDGYGESFQNYPYQWARTVP